MATSLGAAAPPLPLPPAFCPLALASARAAFLAATSASCSGVSSGRPALPGAFFSSSLSAISNPLGALEHRAALHADAALLLTFFFVDLPASRGDALAAPERDVRCLDRTFLLEDAAARVPLGRLGVAL